MHFVGIDLAWSEKNTSGVCIIKTENKKDAKIVDYKIMKTDDEILEFIFSVIKDNNAFIGIDAPLIVPNQNGRRLAEVLVGEKFRKYNAGAHPANRERLSSFTGTIRGEELSKKLERNGFLQNYEIEEQDFSKRFFEVYPHPAIVALFKLNKILKYKAKPKRDYKFRYSEFKKLLDNIKSLECFNPSLNIPDQIYKTNVEILKGQKLKDFEDILDSIICAYIVFYFWYNPKKSLILGNLKEGYILTPKLLKKESTLNKYL